MIVMIVCILTLGKLRINRDDLKCVPPKKIIAEIH